MPLLDVRDVTVRFGGNIALDAVSFDADAGQITGLIGPNGAGKTTLFNAVTGLQRMHAGSVRLADVDLTGMKPSKRARQGMARTFQRLELFGVLSVRENIRVAADIHKSWSGDPQSPAERTDELLGWLGLDDVADERVDALPTGRARLVELARAVATRPRVLLLDEPASGQDDTETEQFGTTLERLASTGTAVVLVEHDVALVMRVCSCIHVLDFGRVIARGTPSEIQANESVLTAYLGSAAPVAPASNGSTPHAPGATTSGSAP